MVIPIPGFALVGCAYRGEKDNATDADADADAVESSIPSITNAIAIYSDYYILEFLEKVDVVAEN